jgi:hypothetical protein
LQDALKGEITMKIAGGKYWWPVVATTCLTLTLSLSAQVETQTTAMKGTPTVVTKVESGEVVSVSGNDLVVKMADGTIRHFASVPPSARVMVAGKQLGISDLKPGMKLQRTITTTRTPMTITTVQTVKGKVWAINPPLSIILTMEDGKNQQFTIPEGQKFSVDGQMVDAFGVRKGMVITATKVTEVPSMQVTHNKMVTGHAAPTESPAPQLETPSADLPVLVAVGDEQAVPAATGETAATPAPITEPTPAPAAASGLPMWLTGLLLLVVLGGIIWWFVSRKNRSNG